MANLKIAGCWFGVICFWLTAIKADENDVLRHRWELEPDLGASWLEPIILPPYPIDVSRILSGNRQDCIDEARLITSLSRRDGIENPVEALESVTQRLQLDDQNRMLRLALVSAFVALSDGSDAEPIWPMLRTDPAVRPVFEKALIGWNRPLALRDWRERVQQSPVSLSELLLAIDGLAALGGPEDQEVLEPLLRSATVLTPVKVAAAEALGGLQPNGLEPLAKQFLAAAEEQAELIAANLLARHTSEAGQGLLAEILESENRPAQVKAFAALVAANPEKARAQAAKMLACPDNTLRLEVLALLNQFDDAESLRIQITALSDKNPRVRETVRENLVVKAQLPALRPIVDETVSYQLMQGSYEGLEQTIFLLTALEDKSRCPNLLDLLDHSRPEIGVIAAWSLEKLADSPEIVAEVEKHAQRMTERHLGGTVMTKAEGVRVAFLLEVLGRHRLESANEMLMKYIPKYIAAAETRTSAIWALGKIWQGRGGNPKLTKLLAERMHDNNENYPEHDLVKFGCALAIGWIGDSSGRQQLQTLEERPPFPIGLAREWALAQYGESASE